MAASGWDVATTYWRPYDTTMAWGSDQMAAVASQVPLGRVSRPEDCANLVTFLCSERGGWINGQLLHSNGGIQ